MVGCRGRARTGARARLVTLVTSAALVATIPLPFTGPAAVAAPTGEAGTAEGTVTAFPSPGSEVASPETQVTLRGLGTAAHSIDVEGSTSGSHAGAWHSLPGDRGQSYLLDKPFSPGETVTIGIDADVRGAAHPTRGTSSYSFRIAVPASVGNLPAAPDEGVPPALRQTAASPVAAADATGPYRSRPDLNPPHVTVNTPASGTAAGLLFAGLFSAGAPAPGIVFDNTGEPIWIPKQRMINLSPINWFGRDALAYFDNTDASSLWNGEWPILDNKYREIARIHAGNGYEADLHDFVPTSAGTVLLLVYNWVTRDLRPYGHPSEFARVIDSVIQEVDPTDGLVLFEWHSLDQGHLPLTDSYESLSTGDVDYSHVNSVDVDTDGNLVASFRNTSSVAKIDRSSGDVIWLFGGKRSDFTFTGGDPGPSRQHDARMYSDGSMSIYDNGNEHSPPVSRVVQYQLNTGAGTATVMHDWRTTPPVFTSFMGGGQTLANGDMLASWSVPGRATEFAQNGTVKFDASLPPEYFSYRIRRKTWSAVPAEAPAIAVDVDGTNATAYASWNGATGVADWQLLAGPNVSSLSVVATAARTGFETQIPATISPDDDTFVVRARKAGGGELGRSDSYVLPVDDPATPWGAPGDTPLTGDFNGDGIDEFVVFRPSTATWYVRGVNEQGVPWAAPDDTPFVGDFNGDGIDDFGVFRPSTATWYVRGVDEQGTKWAGPGDTPFAGDFNGDHVDEYGVFRADTTSWYVRGVNEAGFQWAIPSDTPAIGDYDGNGTDNFGVFRDETGTWYVRQFNDTGTQWAGPGDRPTVLDDNGDGKSDLSVFRPSNATWYLRG